MPDETWQTMLERIHLSPGETPLYKQLADAIADQIDRGDLSVGDRLPPQRDIAQQLRINITTVTRAIGALQQRGLVESRSGRGTRVSPVRSLESSSGFQSAPSDDSGVIDLSVNRPATNAYLEWLAPVLARLPKDARYPAIQDYHPPEGPRWAREAVARWLAPVAGGGDAGQVLLCDGAQHGLGAVLTGIARPGDVILADAVTYQGMNALCRSRGVELIGVPMDREGMLPEALEALCSRVRPRAVFIVPSLHNPTTITLSMARREAITAIARAHNMLIVEDDVYGPLLPLRPTSLAVLEPDLTIHVGSLSKCVAPGLRLGYVVAPRALVGEIATALRIDYWSMSPLTALIASVMIEDGQVDKLVATQVRELQHRQRILRERLQRFDVQTGDTSTHAWLHLPEPWRGSSFALACQQHGVGVLAAEAFTVGRDPAPHAVRINVAAARSRPALERALDTIAELAGQGHRHAHHAL